MSKPAPSTWREFTDYSPGGMSSRQRRKAAARKAGRASGRRRRQLAHARRGTALSPGARLPLVYETRQPSRREFDARYVALWPEPERPTAAASWARGRETAWQHLMASWRLVRATGQHCKTSKPQRAKALAKRGRPRCERTVRRLNQKLEAMGFAGYSHWRAPKGRKDCLVLEWRLTRRVRMLDVIPAPLTVNPGLRPGGSPPYSDPPTASAVEQTAAPPPLTEEQEAERKRKFEAMWAAARRRAIRDCGSPPDEPGGSGARCSEP